MEYNSINIEAERTEKIIKNFDEKFNGKEKYLFSSPGRIEVLGNHTDHNNGNVVAAAINLDTLAVVSKNDEIKANFISLNLNQEISVDLNDLEIHDNEKETTESLIRGIAAKFKNDGYSIGGFNCLIESKVAIGSGLSSSASIEILIGEIFNYFYNDDKIGPIELAKIGQYAENIYFGKPCGLMDQLAISYGGMIGIDFKDLANPKVTPIKLDLQSFDYSFVIVNTGGSHADLTDDYASVPKEMFMVAEYLNQKSLRFLDRKTILNNISELRSKFGDRAILRSLHFLDEDKRAKDIIEILNAKNYWEFCDKINEAGNSSFKWLQNAYSGKDVKNQGISLGMECTENYFDQNNIKGAVKVHGGGFAGTILAVLPNKNVDNYIDEMEKIFGVDAVTKVNIRNSGTKCIGKI